MGQTKNWSHNARQVDIAAESFSLMNNKHGVAPRHTHTHTQTQNIHTQSGIIYEQYKNTVRKISEQINI